MKKTLLILSVGLTGLISAQNAPNVPSKVSRAKMLSQPCNSVANEKKCNSSVPSNGTNNTKQSVKHTAKPSNAQTATKVEIGTAENMFGVLTAACTQVTANQTLNMVALTHRECVSLPFGSGAYETDYSLNGGNTWDTAKAVVFKGLPAATNGTRYPNGIILNPVGNLTASHAYAITSGPHTNGSSWDSVAFGSIRLDSTYPSQKEILMYPNVSRDELTVFSAPHYMSVTNDSVVHSVEEAWSYNSGLTASQGFYGAVVNKGVWSGASHKVTWTSKVLRPHLYSSDGLSAPYDSDAQVSQVAMAWSQDGTVGYVVFWGNLDSTGYDYSSLQPIVYKSTNSGNTWNMMPMFNFGSIPNLVKFLIPTGDSLNYKIPFWDINGDSSFYPGHDVDMTVDMNYNLHIFGAIESGATANPDSGGYIWNPSLDPGRYIYDVYTTSATGGWKAYLLDSLTSPEGIDAATTPWTSQADGALVWGARIQASRSTDGSKVFCTWLDDFQGDGGEIVNPDIVTIGIDVASNLRTVPNRITTDGNNYFLQVSDIALSNETCWDIPCVVVLDPSQGNNDGGITPIEFMYVQGVTLCNSAFNTTGVDEIVKTSAAGFSVSQNFPNPFTNVTSFNLNLSEESVVKVDVYNLVGEKVYSINAQKMMSGTHLITINGSGLSSGIYFYRVTANNNTLTQKMVVQ